MVVEFVAAGVDSAVVATSLVSWQRAKDVVYLVSGFPASHRHLARFAERFAIGTFDYSRLLFNLASGPCCCHETFQSFPQQRLEG